MPRRRAERGCTLSVDFEGRVIFSRDTASLLYNRAILPLVLLVATHVLAYSRKTFHHLVDLPIVENEGGIAVLLYGSEFHEGLIISRGVETFRDVFGPVFVDEKVTWK